MAPPDYRERAYLFGRTKTLSGIVCSPVQEERKLPVVLLGAGIIHKVGPSRASVDLARALARAGHPSLRFDLSGVGDSPRGPESSLQETVTADIGDAVSFLLETTGASADRICLAGYCSGADNAFFVADEDPRVCALVLFDPTVHPTSGFQRRLLIRRLGSLRSWMNGLSGRSLWLRATRMWRKPNGRPPGYYGLLVSSPEETDARAARLTRRGVRSLYVLSRGVQGYCNAPSQIAESMPTGFSGTLSAVHWRPDMDHILSAPEQRRELADTVVGWLRDVGACARNGTPDHPVS